MLYPVLNYKKKEKRGGKKKKEAFQQRWGQVEFICSQKRLLMPCFFRLGLRCLSKRSPLSQATFCFRICSGRHPPLSHATHQTPQLKLGCLDALTRILHRLYILHDLTHYSYRAEQHHEEKRQSYVNARALGQEGCPWGTRCGWLREKRITSHERRKVKQCKSDCCTTV